MANPIIPGSIKDRTGSTAIVRRALVDIKRRYAGLKTDVLAIFGRIPIYQTNDEFSQVYYGLTPDQLAALSVELQAAYARWIASGKDPAHVFWYSVHIDDAQQMGTAQSVANLTALSETYAAARTLERVIYSQAYQTRLAMAQVKSYEHWTGLAAAQKSELSEIIGRAVIDGKNPKAVRTEIMERLEVSRSRAAQYAQTDITDTLRQARMAEADYTAENLGMKIGLLWTSALIPTTRPTPRGQDWQGVHVRASQAVLLSQRKPLPLPLRRHRGAAGLRWKAYSDRPPEGFNGRRASGLAEGPALTNPSASSKSF
jgi:hypothetical protein